MTLYLNAQEILLPVCSELVVVFVSEEVRHDCRVEKISEMLSTTRYVTFMCKPRRFRLLNIIYLYRRLPVFLLY